MCPEVGEKVKKKSVFLIFMFMTSRCQCNCVVRRWTSSPKDSDPAADTCKGHFIGYIILLFGTANVELANVVVAI